MFAGRYAEQGALGKELTPLRARPAGPCTLSAFLHKFAWKCAKAVGLNKPAKGDGATYVKGSGNGFRAEGPWPSASA